MLSTEGSRWGGWRGARGGGAHLLRDPSQEDDNEGKKDGLLARV
jgi:hypothetical protein